LGKSRRIALLWLDKYKYKKHIQRKLAMQAILQSEKEYFANLKLLEKVYSHTSFDTFSQLPEIVAIFTELFLLISFHKSLIDSLEKKTFKMEL